MAGDRRKVELLTVDASEIRRLVASEEGALSAARLRARAGRPPSPEVGALLRWAARTARARHVVEVGSACGVSGLWLLRGMAARGVLTSIEDDADSHRLATAAYQEGGVAERVRCVLADAGEVLPRLSDGGYELFLLQGRATDYPECLAHARRLLAPGGWLVARGLLPDGHDDDGHDDSAGGGPAAGHPSAGDPVGGGSAAGDSRRALRRFLRDLVDDEGFTVTVLRDDGGLALATRAQPTGEA